MYLLEGVNCNDPLNGGYAYGEFSTHQNGFHEGCDFNAGPSGWADEGLGLLAISRQALRYHGTGTRGFGTHQWWELLDGPLTGAYIHYAHAQQFFHGNEGTIAERGDVIGRCGHTGTTLPHLHAVVTRSRPQSWSWYGAPGVPREAILAATYDPVWVCDTYTAWVEAGSAAPERDNEVTPELQAIADALQDSDYPPGEVPALIAACAVWGSNAESLAAWIAEIGALKARVKELEAQLDDRLDDPKA